MNFKNHVDALRLTLQTRTDEPTSPAFTLPACKLCGHAPEIVKGHRTSKYMALHALAGCKLQTVWGDDQNEVQKLWEEQQL